MTLYRDRDEIYLFNELLIVLLWLGARRSAGQRSRPGFEQR